LQDPKTLQLDGRYSNFFNPAMQQLQRSVIPDQPTTLMIAHCGTTQQHYS